jgi:hypothetical protein
MNAIYVGNEAQCECNVRDGREHAEHSVQRRVRHRRDCFSAVDRSGSIRLERSWSELSKSWNGAFELTQSRLKYAMLPTAVAIESPRRRFGWFRVMRASTAQAL